MTDSSDGARVQVRSGMRTYGGAARPCDGTPSASVWPSPRQTPGPSHARILQIGLRLTIAQADGRTAMPVSFRSVIPPTSAIIRFRCPVDATRRTGRTNIVGISNRRPSAGRKTVITNIELDVITSVTAGTRMTHCHSTASPARSKSNPSPR